jgi:hypothetical protein
LENIFSKVAIINKPSKNAGIPKIRRMNDRIQKKRPNLSIITKIKRIDKRKKA